MKNKTENKNIIPKMKPLTIVYAVAIVIVALIIIGGISIYGFSADGKIARVFKKYVPYPVVIINYSKVITTGELNENLSSVRSFYEKQDFSKVGMRVDFSTEDGKKRLGIREKELFNKMIEDKAIEILARKNGIKIASEAVDQSVNRKLEEYGTRENVEKSLADLYGWTLDDFKEKVVKPSMYREELEKLILSQNENEFATQAKEKIEKAKGELEEDKNFDEVAKSYSEGITAEDGGELGWFKKDQLITEVADTMFSFTRGQRSDVIESPLGYHIVEVEEKKTEGDNEMIKIKQVFTRKKTFVNWLDEQIKTMKIFIPLKDYYWDSQKGIVDFSDEKMRDFEKNLLENFQGDASIIF